MARTFLLFSLFTFSLMASPAHAIGENACFASASYKFHLDPILLKAISKTESNFNPLAISPVNKNGTYDYGMMQKNLNEKVLLTLKHAGFSKKDLFDPCTSIYLGAYDLHQCIKVYGQTWRAVGCYNTGARKRKSAATEAARRQYVSKVRHAYYALLAQKEIK